LEGAGAKGKSINTFKKAERIGPEAVERIRFEKEGGHGNHRKKGNPALMKIQKGLDKGRPGWAEPTFGFRLVEGGKGLEIRSGAGSREVPPRKKA